MNILISSNREYLDKYVTMIYSLKRHVSEHIVVFFMNLRLSEIDKAYFLNAFEPLDVNVKFIEVKGLGFEDYPIDYHLSLETYYRIIAQFLLPDNVDRILWLDADIVVLQDITSFYYQSFCGKKYVVCEDIINKTDNGKRLKNRIGLPQTHIYFNAGVMLMNIGLLRNTTNMEDIMKSSNCLKDKVKWFDQDILNILYQGELKYDNPLKYNYQLQNKENIPKCDMSEICILHYNSKDKPWEYNNIKPSSIYYWREYARVSKTKKKESRQIYKNKIADCVLELKGYFLSLIKL